jgi:thioredoxin-related protein
MKFKLSFIVILLVFNFTFAQKQTLFLDNNFATVFQQSKENKKPIVVMFYAKWCSYCNKMKNEVFTDQKVIEFYTKNFNCFAVDVESEYGKNFKHKSQDQFLIKSYPTFAFYNTNGEITNVLTGQLTVENFLKEGSLNLSPDNHYNTIKSNFNADTSNYDKAFAYILITKRLGFNPTEIAQTYLKTVPKSDYYTEKNWRLISNGITNFATPEFKDILVNRYLYEKASSKTRVERKINYTITENFKELIEKQDSTKYNKIRKVAVEFNNKSIDSLVFFNDATFYETLNDWKNYQKTIETGLENFAKENTNFINSVAANYFVFISDKKALLQVSNWQNQAIQKSPSIDKYVLATNLLIKANENTKALQKAEEGISFAKQMGFSTTELDNLIKNIKSKK